MDFLVINCEHLSVSLLEIIEPYEIKESSTIGRKNLIFKEIFYVRIRKYNIKTKSNKKIHLYSMIILIYLITF
jgi:hypothetical protein